MKIKILTMAFTRPELVEKCIEALYKRGVPNGVEHYILDQHYPLPSKAQNSERIKNICIYYGLKYLNAGKNLGYHEGINWAIEQMDLADGDVVVNFDQDAQIAGGSEAWLCAIFRSFFVDKTLACVGINNETIDRELKERGFFDESKNYLVMRFMKAPVVMSIIAWQVGFIREVGGLKENTLHYGGVEAVMWPYLCERGRRWAVLPAYWEDVSLWHESDPEYREWKVKHGQELSFKEDFETYLRAIGRIE